jgi:hypothetical protein
MKDDVIKPILHNQLAVYYKDLHDLLNARYATTGKTIVLKLEQYVVVSKSVRVVHHELSLSAKDTVLLSAPITMVGSTEEVLWRMMNIHMKMVKLIMDNTTGGITNDITNG